MNQRWQDPEAAAGWFRVPAPVPARQADLLQAGTTNFLGIRPREMSKLPQKLFFKSGGLLVRGAASQPAKPKR